MAVKVNLSQDDHLSIAKKKIKDAEAWMRTDPRVSNIKPWTVDRRGDLVTQAQIDTKYRAKGRKMSKGQSVYYEWEVT